MSKQHSPEFVQLVDAARAHVREVDVAETQSLVRKGAALIDVREDHEWSDGHAAGAIHLGRGIIERDICQTIPDKTRPLVLYCGGGFRSALAAENLKRMGYQNVFSLAGGWKAWSAAGAPTTGSKE